MTEIDIFQKQKSLSNFCCWVGDLYNRRVHLIEKWWFNLEICSLTDSSQYVLHSHLLWRLSLSYYKSIVTLYKPGCFSNAPFIALYTNVSQSSHNHCRKKENMYRRKQKRGVGGITKERRTRTRCRKVSITALHRSVYVLKLFKVHYI